MPRSFQQQLLQRKLIYFSLILVLFFATLILRRSFVEAKAEELGLREKSQGKVELTGSALRLTLTGSRGLVVCSLWMLAQDRQMHHEWNELELIVRTLTKLQPHFITPWLFQSWNLAYNVSVESDRVKDKYFYISRGLDLLAEGERQNEDNPDLRNHMGMYYEGKFGVSDEHNTLRSLLQLSCIDPKERDSARFRPNTRDRFTVDMAQLENFCRAHPVLVRRLYEKLGCQTPRELVDFLEECKKIPSRFDERASLNATGGTPMKAPEERFPILPAQLPRPPFDQDEVTNDSLLGDSFGNYMAARSWFGYAQDPLGLPEPRMPRGAAVILLKIKPALAQAYVAMQVEEEGWFGDPWQPGGWFPEEKSRTQVPQNWASDSWRKAYQMFKACAETTGIHKPGRSHEVDRRVTNFEHWFAQSEVEQTAQAVAARRRFFEARQLYLNGSPSSWVVEKYEDKDAFGPPATWTKDRATGWTQLFLDGKHKSFRNDELVQVETYELERKYLDAVLDDISPETRHARALRTSVATAAAVPFSGAIWLAAVYGSAQLRGPFDGVDEEGKPLIGPEAMRVVQNRRGEYGNSRAPAKSANRPSVPTKTGPGAGPSAGT